MGKSDKRVRNKMIVVRMNDDEYNRLQVLFKQSACHRLSDYLRKVALQKPVLIKYRNESAADFLAVANQLKNELNAIGNNFNQTVHKLHTLTTIPEIEVWAIQNEKSKQVLLAKTEEIRLRMNEIYDQLCCRK